MPLGNNILRYALASLLAIFTITLSARESREGIKIRTVVIDAGHGGKDAGAISKNNAIKEKDITLSVALKFGDLIKKNYPETNVIYTRTGDTYVELSKRAEIANRNKADLFVSIHVNSQKGTSATGSETFVMGTHKSNSNFEICKLENSVIVLEDDYKSKYEGFDPNSPESYIIFSLLQNTHLEQSLKFASLVQDNFRLGPIKVNRGVKQGGLLVLWKTTMPAVLTEIGFISNAIEASKLKQDYTQTQIATRLFNAFAKYKTDYEGGSPVIEETSDKPAVPMQRYEPETKADSEQNATLEQNSEELKLEVAPKPIQKSAQQPEAQQKTQAQVQQTQAQPQQKAQTQPQKEKSYRIQILSVSRQLKSNAPDLKGRTDVYYIYMNGAYKYCIGEYPTREAAAADLPNIRSQFKGAFIIFAEK